MGGWSFLIQKRLGGEQSGLKPRLILKSWGWGSGKIHSKHQLEKWLCHPPRGPSPTLGSHVISHSPSHRKLMEAFRI